MFIKAVFHTFTSSFSTPFFGYNDLIEFSVFLTSVSKTIPTSPTYYNVGIVDRSFRFLVKAAWGPVASCICDITNKGHECIPDFVCPAGIGVEYVKFFLKYLKIRVNFIIIGTGWDRRNGTTPSAGYTSPMILMKVPTAPVRPNRVYEQPRSIPSEWEQPLLTQARKGPFYGAYRPLLDDLGPVEAV
jgi:hypothetical protein